MTVSEPVLAPREKVFAAMVDLRSQEKWILGTRLFGLSGPVDVPEVGSRLAALTGVAGIGVLDLMVVTQYEPPVRWETEHVGAFRGRGVFAVESVPSGSRAVWVEEIELPFGLLGRLGWVLVRPATRWGLHRSLRRLARGVESGTLPLDTGADGPRNGPRRPEQSGL